MGFGLRWAQMGLFETYRIAGGEAGMRHFIDQFGPALAWPWTKLMDVPELTDELIDRIAGQSDAQSGAHSIRELERIRDRNLVAILRGLKAQDWGAGRRAAGAGSPGCGRRSGDLTRPIETLRRAVPLDWTDYNGHMNEAKYLQAFGDATDRLMEIVGCDAGLYRRAAAAIFTAETHIRHLDEVLRRARRSGSRRLCLEGARQEDAPLPPHVRGRPAAGDRRAYADACRSGHPPALRPGAGAGREAGSDRRRACRACRGPRGSAGRSAGNDQLRR